MACAFKRRFSTTRFLRQTLTMNSAELSGIFQPPVNRSMRELDRSFFRKVVPTSAATILDPRQISKVRSVLLHSRELLHVTGIRPVRDDPTEPSLKCLMLKPEVRADQSESWSQQLSQLVDENVVRIRPYELELTYDNWTLHNILEATLPEFPDDQKETPTGFAIAGHIAHLNLRNQYLPYKQLIGQVVLDKNPTIRTVINKTLDVGSESVYRTFPYEILAGDNDLETTLSEQGCDFRFNFAEVYWNSRLGTEHERMVGKFKQGEAVCDVMAGVGPFAIPAGKKGVFVRANDLNPESFKGLKWAMERNKVQPLVSATCMDGRQFIREETRKLFASPRSWTHVPRKLRASPNAPPVVQEQKAKKQEQVATTITEPITFDHYIMNLPASAVEFLDAFQGLHNGQQDVFAPHTNRKLPMVHVYTFQAKKDTELEESQEVCQKVSHHLGAEVKLTDDEVEIFYVRLVSPKKRMYCASFRLPPAVAFGDPPESRPEHRPK